jgi:hypothetical protein
MTRDTDYTRRMVGVIPFEMIEHMWGQAASEILADTMAKHQTRLTLGPLTVAFQFLAIVSRAKLKAGPVTVSGNQTYTLLSDGQLWLEDGRGNGHERFVHFVQLTDDLYINHVPEHAGPGEILFEVVGIGA